MGSNIPPRFLPQEPPEKRLRPNVYCPDEDNWVSNTKWTTKCKKELCPGALRRKAEAAAALAAALANAGGLSLAGRAGAGRGTAAIQGVQDQRRRRAPAVTTRQGAAGFALQAGAAQGAGILVGNGFEENEGAGDLGASEMLDMMEDGAGAAAQEGAGAERALERGQHVMEAEGNAAEVGARGVAGQGLDGFVEEDKDDEELNGGVPFDDEMRGQDDGGDAFGDLGEQEDAAEEESATGGQAGQGAAAGAAQGAAQGAAAGAGQGAAQGAAAPAEVPVREPRVSRSVWIQRRNLALYEGAKVTVLQQAMIKLCWKRDNNIKDNAFDELCKTAHHVELPAGNFHPPSLYLMKVVLGVDSVADFDRHMCVMECAAFPPLPPDQWLEHREDKCSKCGKSGLRSTRRLRGQE
jgi:hypothetical protein